LIVRRLTGIPYSFTAHGSDIHVDQRMLGAKIRASAFAVMISEYNRLFVLDKCGGDLDEKMVVIHCGVRMEDHQMPFLPTSPPEDPFTILCVASLNEVKGHRYLVEAARHLKESGEDFLCRLVGDGPLRDRLAGQISEAGLEKEFVLHGALPRGEVARRMRRADAAVLPSVMTSRGDREGIPVALMEAMATGLPAVASDISGIPELVEDGRTGLLVPPRESRALADALHRLMEDPELRRKFGQRGREKVREEFTITGSVERLLELWGGASAG
jgi:glycosyltransferase involved in cell wall biosynthesis